MPLQLDITLSLMLLALGFYLLWGIPYPRRRRPLQEGTRPRPGLSIIIPARNEEANISRLLPSLRQQDLTSTEIIVVDDGSTDRTAFVAREFDAHVIRNDDLPEGWTGKCWACWQGAQRAQGDLLLFLDADTWLEPGGLDRLLDTYGEVGGLLSVQPYHVTKKAYEGLSSIFNIVLMAGMNAFTPRGHNIPPSGAFGPCLLARREDYFLLGGHAQESVRGNILESIPLAKSYLRNDLPVRCYGGRGTISFRMYPEGLGQLVEGWSKGFATGALNVRWPYLLMSIGWVTGCFNVLAGTIGALVLLNPWILVAHALVYALCAGQIAWMLSRIGRYRAWTIWLFPIPLLFFLAVLLRSLILVWVLGRVPWRGRTVDTRRKG